VDLNAPDAGLAAKSIAASNELVAGALPHHWTQLATVLAVLKRNLTICDAAERELVDAMTNAVAMHNR